MLFGYIIVRALLWLVRGFPVLPSNDSRGFARALNAATRPFHVVNHLGSLGGARVLGHGGMERVMDEVTDSLMRTLDQASESNWPGGCTFQSGGTRTSPTT
jgi:hypothetical protein